jgi:hypothetical protein
MKFGFVNWYRVPILLEMYFWRELLELPAFRSHAQSEPGSVSLYS